MKPIIRYYRECIGTIETKKDDGTFEVKNLMAPRGCVVAIGREKIGWSLCNPRDNFSYKKAKKIAFGRAEKAPQRPNISKLPWELADLYTHVQDMAGKIDWNKE